MNYKREIEEILGKLSEKPVMVLATSLHDSVSARNMSVVVLGDKLYFQTDRNMKKAADIRENSSVALCVDSFQIRGTAKIIGTWEENGEIKKMYCAKHLSSYEKYKNVKGEIVVEVSIHEIETWEYVDSKPYISTADLTANTYTRQEYKLS